MQVVSYWLLVTGCRLLVALRQAQGGLVAGYPCLLLVGAGKNCGGPTGSRILCKNIDSGLKYTFINSYNIFVGNTYVGVHSGG